MYSMIKNPLEVCGDAFKMKPVSMIVFFPLALFSCIVVVQVWQRFGFN